MKLDYYIESRGRKLRCGYTTGTCAAAAARIAADFLLSGSWPAMITIETPSGLNVTAEPECCSSGFDYASCAVRKDGGDDSDVTDGMLIYALVRKKDSPGISIDGGEGIGRVTRPGLDQPLGNAAINSIPRKMIAEHLIKAAKEYSYNGGFTVIISAPDGQEKAVKTFNSKLGINGGLSILGTTGIVKPMSEQALIDTIKTELRMRRAEGQRDLLVVPGNIGSTFSDGTLRLKVEDIVQCSNYIGDTIDYAASLGFKSLLLIGHAGKLVKLAAGIMNTHSRWADGRAEVLTAHAAICGASIKVAQELMGSLTIDEGLALLEKAGLRSKVMESIIRKIEDSLHRRAGTEMLTEAILFSSGCGILGTTGRAGELLKLHIKTDNEG